MRRRRTMLKYKEHVGIVELVCWNIQLNSKITFSNITGYCNIPNMHVPAVIKRLRNYCKASQLFFLLYFQFCMFGFILSVCKIKSTHN